MDQNIECQLSFLLEEQEDDFPVLKTFNCGRWEPSPDEIRTRRANLQNLMQMAEMGRMALDRKIGDDLEKAKQIVAEVRGRQTSLFE